MEDIKKVFEKIKDYWLMIPVAIYFIGFFYVQGLLGYITKNLILPNTFSISASTEFYIKNGLKISILMIIPLIISIIMFNMLKKKKSVAEVKTYSMFFMPIFLVVQLVGWTLYIRVATYFKNNNVTYEYYEIFNLLFSLIYYSLSFTVYIIGFYIISELTKEYKVTGFINEYKDNKESKKYKLSFYLYHVFFTTISLVFSLYCSGLSEQDKIIQSALNNKGGKITYADVITDDSSKRYIFLDIVNNYFIGFDINYDHKSSSSVIIPLTKIKQLNVIELSSPIKVRTLTQEDEDKARKKVIEDYYLSLRTKDARLFINSLSWNLYKKPPYTLIPAEELKKIWDRNKNFYNQIPIYYQMFKSVDKNNTALYVIEYHDTTIKYLEFKLIFEKDRYKIDNILDVRQSLIVQE
jgi:hypothetical protein